MQTLKLLLAVTAATVVSWLGAGCRNSENGDFLGSAVVETETYEVPALEQGPLIAVLHDEGDSVSQGELLALVDTVPYALQYQEAAAGLGEIHANLASQTSQIAADRAEAIGWNKEARRVTPLSQAGAATAQQLDQVTTSQDAARHRLQAAQRGIKSLGAKKQALQYQLDWLRNQVERCRVEAPADGFILTRYRNPGEAVSPGQAVFELGRRDSVYADFYVPQPVMASLRIGAQVHFRVEESGSPSPLVPAEIRFIASDAEFTPKNIQTRESRSELVFRVRAYAASQNGLLKRGLPIEVWR